LLFVISLEPPLQMVNALFEASNTDNLGGIYHKEFNVILNVSCSQIMGQILVNYATIIFFVAFLAKKIVDHLGIRGGSNTETICEQLTGLV
jgi:hypothetical protein